MRNSHVINLEEARAERRAREKARKALEAAEARRRAQALARFVEESERRNRNPFRRISNWLRNQFA